LASEENEVDAVFTGIVEELGEVVALEESQEAGPPGAAMRLTVRGPLVTADASAGDSIAINGVCLTVTTVTDGTFSADVISETLNRSSLGALGAGSVVNLERSMRAGGRLGGHIVQGHVDAIATILERRPGDVVRISVPPGLSRYVIEKGSIAVNGISLTVSALGTGGGADWFEVSLIPETLARTTLGHALPGDTVNLEVDMIAKYVESLLGREAQR
jgi:riboflavin synthase